MFNQVSSQLNSLESKLNSSNVGCGFFGNNSNFLFKTPDQISNNAAKENTLIPDTRPFNDYNLELTKQVSN